MHDPSELDPRAAANVPEPAPPTRAGGPIVVMESPGFYAWCRCARSRHVPYCDGSHGSSALLPLIVQLEQPERVRWCGCGRTATPPRCDDLGCARTAAAAP